MPAQDALLTEAEKQWVVYMEEAILIDFLEGNFPSSTRQLWIHMSEGGSFPDHLGVEGQMQFEDLPRFFQLRQWTPTLQNLLPAGTHFTSQHRQQQWQHRLRDWISDVRGELEHLRHLGWDPLLLLQSVIARAHRRGHLDYITAIADVVTLAQSLTVGDIGSPASMGPGMNYEAWAVETEAKLFALFSLPGDPRPTENTTEAPSTDMNRDDSEEMNRDDNEVMDTPGASSSDVVCLVGHKINKRWLKSPSPRRGRPSHSSRPMTVTTETCDLSNWASPRRRRSPAPWARAERSRAIPKPRPRPRPEGRGPGDSGSTPARHAPRERETERREPEVNVAEAGPLSMQEAVANWLIWLNIMDVGEEPSRFLPADIEHRILDNFMDLSPADQLTSALALTSMIQQLMASVGGILQDAVQMTARRGQGMRADNDEIVEVEADEEESGLMQTTMSSSWYTLLQDLRQAFENMSKEARRANSRWLKRRLHHRCTNTDAGYLLGHMSGRVADLAALLEAVMADLEDMECQETPSTSCTTWTLEWWARLEPHLPISLGSDMAAGRAVSSTDPPNMLFSKPLPANFSSEGEDAVVVQGTRAAGPPPPMPVQPLFSQSPTEQEMLNAAVEFEEARDAARVRELEQEDQERRERQHDLEMEDLYEKHRAATYRDWEQWVMAEEMNQPRKRSRGTVTLTTRVGDKGEPGTSSTIHVPLDSEASGTVTIHMAFQEAATPTPSTLPVDGDGIMPTAVDEVLDAAAAEAEDRLGTLSMEALDRVYHQWVGGIVTSADVVKAYGSGTLSILQVQRLAYFDGAVYQGMVQETEAKEAEQRSDSGGS